jgi:MoxR-like ATPase
MVKGLEKGEKAKGGKGKFDLSAYIEGEALALIQEGYEVTHEDLNADNLIVSNDASDIPKFLQFMAGQTAKTGDPAEVNFKMAVSESTFGKGEYSASKMGDALKSWVDSGATDEDTANRRDDHVKMLSKMGGHIAALKRVFGFGDARQLEAFMAAWLMKDSTCRLSGIPGTGKTTVINTASVLVCNSYGYYNGQRFLRNPRRANRPYALDLGQDYFVEYGEDEERYNLWNEWRFTEWNAKSKQSGAYLYDFDFLQRMGKRGRSMNPAAFAEYLFNVKTKSIKVGDVIVGLEVKSIPITLTLKTKEGKIKAGKTKGADDGFSITHGVNYGEILYDRTNLKETGGILYYHPSGISTKTKYALATDAGGNEGYGFRRYLIDYYYDDRLDMKDESAGRQMLAAEMLREIGIAKIDYDKRADEVLYGMDIRQVTKENPTTREIVATYEFEPLPRKVVTQPIKFFNEANRSQSGVEDAILGLIAEKTVEYRGKTFTSPSFVAWMDTNPHQKGNDLAFVDRIDMELFFSTISLGERYAQLSERYETQTGEDPTSLLVALMGSDGMGRLIPSRFNNTPTTDSPNFGLKQLWDFIQNIPFRPPKVQSGYDGLRDIAAISVLFTQRYFARDFTTEILGKGKFKHNIYEAQDVYASPLIDISKASNPQLLGNPNEPYAKRYGDTKVAGKPLQPPELFKRVLGFRFTNSLVKLSRAFAFLRGKEYVTRQEILDALPFVVGHRLGPARAGEDDEGRSNGLIDNKAFGSLLNEQELIRELVVRGYLLGQIKDNALFKSDLVHPTDRPTQTMMDAWDAFFARCSESLDSAIHFADFEVDILLKVKNVVRGNITGDAVVEQVTPVHWHLCEMVVENERKGKTNFKGNYAKRYDEYFKRITRPYKEDDWDSIYAAMYDYCLFDFFLLRGEIAQEPFLFTDDRQRLLELVESQIASIAGVAVAYSPNKANANRVAVATKAQFTQSEPSPGNIRGTVDESVYQISVSPTQFPIRTYGDALGAYGTVINGGLTQLAGQDPATAKLTDDVLSWAHQDMVLVDSLTKGMTEATIKKTTLGNTIINLKEAFAPFAGSGMTLGKSGKTKQFNEFMGDLTSGLEGAFKKGGDSDKKLGLLKNGLEGCFMLKHTKMSGGHRGLKAKAKQLKNDGDFLRLWVSLRLLSNTSGATQKVALCFGVTSNFLIGCKYDEPTGDFTIGDYALITNTDIVSYDIMSSGSKWDTLGIADAGNITRTDRIRYHQLFDEAIRNSRQS